MYEYTHFLLLILSFVGGYKLSEYEHSSKINSSNNNSSVLTSSIDPLLSDAEHTTYEAWKNIHNYVYPKLYKSTEPNGHIKSSRNITMDDIENENFYTRLDQSLIESKHANVDGGSAENGMMASGSMNGLSGVLQLIDPLLLMAVLGFVAYIINSVLCLVDKLHLSNLLGTSSASSAFYNMHRRQQEAIVPSFDVNQNFLRDLERMFRLAIELYERKM